MPGKGKLARESKSLICPKCSGLVVGDSDHYGPYLHCLNCGWIDIPCLPYLTETGKKVEVQRQHTHKICPKCTVMTLERTISQLVHERTLLQTKLYICQKEIVALEHREKNAWQREIEDGL